MSEPLQVFLNSALKEWLRDYASRHDLSMTTVIRFVLERERANDEAATHGKPLYTRHAS